jgi:hypothetical protein
MYLVIHDEDENGARVWKGFDWDTLERLYQKGFIGSPVGRAKSVFITMEGIKRSKNLFEQHFSSSRK